MKNETLQAIIDNNARFVEDHDQAYFQGHMSAQHPRVTMVGCCDSRCQVSNFGCRGCYGPAPGVIDQGAKALCAIASVIEAKGDAEVERITAEIPDVLRTFNQFAIPTSLIKRKVL